LTHALAVLVPIEDEVAVRRTNFFVAHEDDICFDAAIAIENDGVPLPYAVEFDLFEKSDWVLHGVCLFASDTMLDTKRAYVN
jgi:hypothetical protein